MKFKIFTLTLLIVSIFYTSIPQQAFAQVAFGGRILMTYECTCSGGWYILMYDYKTKMTVPLVFQFGVSMLRANYNIFTPGVQTLGSYTSGGICLMVSLDCAGITVQGTISPFGQPGIGTTLY